MTKIVGRPPSPSAGGVDAPGGAGQPPAGGEGAGGARGRGARGPPQRPAEPDIAKRASPLDADSLEPHRDGRLPRRGPFEQLALVGAPVISCARSWARARPSPSSSPRCAAV